MAHRIRNYSVFDTLEEGREEEFFGNPFWEDPFYHLTSSSFRLRNPQVNQFKETLL
jgi:hypothetical protein